MHIDHEHLDLQSEGDVETKVLTPLITEEIYLGVPSRNFYSKEYLAATELDKGSKKIGGYFPDYSIWMHGFLVMVVEAKKPGVPIEAAYREAALYASHLNRQYLTGLNPCQFLIASNGDDVWFGRADAAPEFELKVHEIIPGGAKFAQVREKYGEKTLRQHANGCLDRTRIDRATRPYMRAGGQALINAKRALNTFASDLSPILRRYFSSQSVSDIKEISRRAYVSSAEVTEYDKVLESLLRDRASIRRDTIVERLEPTRRTEPRVSKSIAEYIEGRPAEGQLQIIQGAVGAGKSLFIRRYKETLQGEQLKKACRWAWIDYNGGPADLSSAQTWLCQSFIESFGQENPEIDLASSAVLRGIFSKQIMRRRGIYEEIGKDYPERAAIMRAEDLAKWQDDPLEHTRGIAQYIRGNTGEVLIVVMDNVDRLDLNSQLNAFQLSLWFMEQTKCFIILQMRDETYERFKNRPPLDTFRSGIAFHISPPRFIDVVKRRLDLSVEYLSQNSTEIQEYVLPSGVRIRMPRSTLGDFLHELYVELFERRGNISRVLESLSGSDVRRALEMFVSIITSGHLGEDQITSQVRGAQGIAITEENVLKILMRTEYSFFSDHSGFVSNIFFMDSSWKKPNNFLVIEILFFLATHRRDSGQIRIEGYFTVKYISDYMLRYGFDIDDTFSAVNYALRRYLISADHMNNTSVELDDSVKISASGYIHLRVLSDRLEYLYGVIATTPIADEDMLKYLAQFVDRENKLGSLTIEARRQAVENFYRYLLDQATSLARASGETFDIGSSGSGTSYVLRQMRSCLERLRSRTKITEEPNILDQ